MSNIETVEFDPRAVLAEIAALKNEVELLRAKEEIRELIYRYGYAADVAMYDDFIGTLTEDVVWTASGTSNPGLPSGPAGVFRGRTEAFAAVSGPGHKEIAGREQHVMANFIINVEGDAARAVGHLILTIHHWGGFAIGTCRYAGMKFRRTNGRWLISEITFRETGQAEGLEMVVRGGLLSGKNQH